LTCKNEYINEEILKYLIEKGANVNKPDKDGNTPLIISCKSNNDNIVKYLIQNRADISKVNNDGDSPLKIAKEKNNEKIIECINNKIKIDKELFRNRIKSKIQNDSQYKILYKNFNEWKIYNWNQLNDSTICSPHFKIGKYIWRIELNKKNINGDEIYSFISTKYK